MSETYPHKYELQQPIEYAGELIKEVKYRDPKGKDLRGIKLKAHGEFEMGELVGFFARISEQSPPFFDELGVQDYMNIMGLGADFLGSGQ